MTVLRLQRERVPNMGGAARSIFVTCTRECALPRPPAPAQLG